VAERFFETLLFVFLVLKSRRGTTKNNNNKTCRFFRALLSFNRVGIVVLGDLPKTNQKRSVRGRALLRDASRRVPGVRKQTGHTKQPKSSALRSAFIG